MAKLLIIAEVFAFYVTIVRAQYNEGERQGVSEPSDFAIGSDSGFRRHSEKIHEDYYFSKHINQQDFQGASDDIAPHFINHIVKTSSSSSYGPSVILDRSARSVPIAPNLRPLPNNPNLRPIPSDPSLHPIPSDPNVQPIPSDPNLKPIPSDANLRPIPSDPNLRPIPSDPNLKPIPSDPNLRPITSDPNLRPIPSDLNVSLYRQIQT
ncbi:integumentary mucin A.1-like isoform X3 [Schistocerca nitens]|uniref:integumentary mucin A.1-like isoform X3 n=1 Tax=Schistocerca nitens TaxID=7011 RepID=UPI00211756C2|nr:integumentary mucin A.1-like isoform X3 [Schistocerca nitens]